jgi:hypothetical protein
MVDRTVARIQARDGVLWDPNRGRCVAIAISGILSIHQALYLERGNQEPIRRRSQSARDPSKYVKRSPSAGSA